MKKQKGGVTLDLICSSDHIKDRQKSWPRKVLVKKMEYRPCTTTTFKMSDMETKRMASGYSYMYVQHSTPK